MKIIDEVRDAFSAVELGTVFTTAEIKNLVYEKYGRNKTSVIPSDYCYNMTNKGKIGRLKDFNIFVQEKHGVFKYVGENYKY